MCVFRKFVWYTVLSVVLIWVFILGFEFSAKYLTGTSQRIYAEKEKPEQSSSRFTCSYLKDISSNDFYLYHFKDKDSGREYVLAQTRSSQAVTAMDVTPPAFKR